MLPTHGGLSIPWPLMADLNSLTQRLLAREELSSTDIEGACAVLASPDAPDGDKASFLAALSDKGETAAEIAAFARAFRARAIDPELGRWAPEAIDIVGTGGDMAGGFNISSMVVLTLASAGVPVMKHGNRGITSKCGSADLLAALGFDLQAPAEKIRSAMDALGYVFLFAPAYHPTFKHIGPVRKQLAAQGRRSVFNILGPLINPGRPEHVLLGVFAESWVTRLADVLELLGTRAGLAAHGIITPGRGIDELTTATPNRVRGIGRLHEIDGLWQPEDHGFVASTFSDLEGGDLETNLAIVQALLDGKAPRGLVDTIVLNAATALWITGRSATVTDGAAQSRELLLGGAVKAKIAATREFFQK
jgi:anthranilate phosphoribosyltransferase